MIIIRTLHNDIQINQKKNFTLIFKNRANQKAHATFHETNKIDVSTGLTFAMDLTPLIMDVKLDIESYVVGFIDRFRDDVVKTLRRLI